MNIVFPDNMAIESDSVKRIIKGTTGLKYLPIDIANPSENLITINKVSYVFKYLNQDFTRNKGGNAIVLSLHRADEIDFDAPQYENPDMVLKIHKRPKSFKEEYIKTSEKRFIKEIEALKKCRDFHFQNVIEIYDSGTCKIYNAYADRVNEFLCYTMEFAQHDLKTFVELNHSELNTEIKLGLCISLASGLNELLSLGYYHRDIKPDNIFMVGNEWKIGDLGLMAERDSTDSIDDGAQLIGPRGWISPEAMSKYLSEGKGFEFQHNCKIDHQSDIFMLGKVFWYIFQYNAPIGSIKEKDFQMNTTRVYPIIRTMLNYSKSRRYQKIEEVIKLLKPIETNYLLEPY